MKKMLLIGMLLAGVFAVAGEVAADRAAAGMDVQSVFETKNYAKFSLGEDDGKPVFLADGMAVLISRRSFEIKPGAKYRVSVRARALGDKPSYMIIGFAPYDAQGRLLGIVNINGVDQTITELTRPCQARDKVIYVKDASRWLGSNRTVAFDAKADRSDLPNFNVSNSTIESIAEVEEDGSWKITFRYPVGYSRPAGTVVRMHRFGGTYLYTRSTDVGTAWTTYTGSDFSSSSFRQGTVSARAVILCNYGSKGAQGRIVFDELIVEEIVGE